MQIVYSTNMVQCLKLLHAWCKIKPPWSNCFQKNQSCYWIFYTYIIDFPKAIKWTHVKLLISKLVTWHLANSILRYLDEESQTKYIYNSDVYTWCSTAECALYCKHAQFILSAISVINIVILLHKMDAGSLDFDL